MFIRRQKTSKADFIENNEIFSCIYIMYDRMYPTSQSLAKTFEIGFSFGVQQNI